MISTHKHQAFTLLEVLIATSIIMVGIFGIASAIGLSGQIVIQSFRADMVANGGRAALQALLASDFIKNNSGNSVVFEAPDTDNYDIGKDHLKQKSIREEDTPPTYDLTLNGDYTWVRTYSRISNAYCEVSAAVAYKATNSGNNPISAGVTIQGSNVGVSDAMNISVSYTDSMENFEAGEYVFLFNSNEGHWYRIESLISEGNLMYLTVSGPQFQNDTPSNLKTTGGIKGVYSQVVPIENK